MVGNAVTTCSTTMGFAAGNCAGARQGASAGVFATNNVYFMDYVDVDGDLSTFNSSSSTLTLPANADVVWSGLYWTGDTSPGTPLFFNEGSLAIPGGSAPPTPNQRNRIRFSTPSSAYTEITAQQIDEVPINDVNGNVAGFRYSAFADVTALVKSGGNGNYFGANIQTATGADRFGGWAIIVVYKDSSQVLRSITVFDGFVFMTPPVLGGSSSIDVGVSGFLTPPNGIYDNSFGALSYEGDVGFTGDQFMLKSGANPFENISDLNNPINNIFNSTNSILGTPITTRNPNFPNMLAMDVDILSLTRADGSNILPNGATSVDLRFTTEGDVYFPTAFFFSAQIFQPVLTDNFSKTVTDINGGELHPGEILEYTIEYENTGNDGATDVVITDAIPAGTTYVPGSLVVASDPGIPDGDEPKSMSDTAGNDQAEFDSGNNQVVFRTGTGADGTNGGFIDEGETVILKFRVQVDPDITTFPTTISNQAIANYRGESTGVPFSGSSNDPTTPTPDDPTDIEVVEVKDPNVLLVKRITRINGQTQNGSTDLDVYIDDADYPYDDNTLDNPEPDPIDTENWPTPNTFLKGLIDGGKTKPGDEIEYTIYFLSSGGQAAVDVIFCDKIPDFQTFVPDTFNAFTPAPDGGVGANRGILVEYNGSALTYSNDDDGDTAQYYPPDSTLPAACDGAPAQDEDNGAIVVNLGNLPNADGPGTPAASYGLIRFRAKIK